MTTRQQEILHYLYQFRFLTRNQLQALLNHKQYNRIIIWLNELTESGYIKRYYDKKKVTEPAIYSLGNNGRKYLKQNAVELKIKPQLLDRIWRESTLSKQFRDHCLQVSDLYLSLLQLTTNSMATLHFYTKTDLTGLKYLILPYPDAYFSIKETNGRQKAYFLDIFDDLPARMMLRKRVRQYFEYFEADYWQDHNTNPFPTIIFICPDNRSLNYLTTHIQTRLNDEPELDFYLSTKDVIHRLGFCREALQKVVPKEE
jgi:hypothetical protein